MTTVTENAPSQLSPRISAKLSQELINTNSSQIEQARNFLVTKATPLIVEFMKVLLHARTNDVLEAMHEFTTAKLNTRLLEGSLSNIPPIERNDEDSADSKSTTSDGSLCTEDFLPQDLAKQDKHRDIDLGAAEMVVDQFPLPCALCRHYEAYAHEVNMQMLRCAYCVLSLETQSPWKLATAVTDAKRTVAACCKVVATARSNLDAEKASLGGNLIVKTRGGSDSSSSDTGSDSASESDAVPDIMNCAPLRWRVGPRPSVCAESTRDMANYELPFYRKNSADREMLEKFFAGHLKIISCDEHNLDTFRFCSYGGFLFTSITDKAERNQLIDAMKPVTIAAGASLIRQGDSGDGMYFVAQGTLKVDRDGPEGNRLLREIGPGDCVGELAVLYQAKRSSNVTAVDDCQLWFLDRQSFNILARGSASRKRERYELFLKSVPVLKKTGMFSRGRIADALQEQEFKRGEVIIHEGELQADAFYLIIKGSATVTRSAAGFTPKHLGPGSYFGEIAILKQCPRQATVTADTDLLLARFERRAFKKVMEDIIPILSKEMDAYT